MEYPQLRPVEAFPVVHRGRQMVALRDPSNLVEQTIFVTPEMYLILAHFDGHHSLRDIQVAVARRTGQILMTNDLQQLIWQLDEHLFLESERFAAFHRQVEEEFRALPARPAKHAGTAYDGEPEALRERLEGFLAAARLERNLRRTDRPRAWPPLRGLIAPHIDLHRGGRCFGHAFSLLQETTDADRFVLLGQQHAGEGAMYTATTKDFATPLGLVRTDRDFVAALVRRYDGDLFAEELQHRSEHSVEFLVVFLQHLFGAERPFQIVPLLCGSVHELFDTDTLPHELPAVQSFLAALVETMAESGRKVCLIAGADLSHVGPRFGTSEPLTSGYLQWVEAEDRRLLERTAEMDPLGFYQHLQKDRNRRNVCSAVPIYTLLSAVDAERGELLKYDQAVDQETQSAVTFCSMAFV
jgi:AmmeMemoRadiSam system protein B